VIHRLRLETMQRSRISHLETSTTSTTPKIGNLEALQRSAPMFGSPTVQRSADGTVIQRSWWNPFDWAKEAAGWLGEKFMDGLEWMGEKAAKAFMEVFAVAAKPFGETGKQVLNAIKSIGSSLLNVISNPGQFARNLIEGIKLGFGNFITNAPKHLTSVLGSFLGGKGLNLTFPTKLEPLPILMAFISSLNLGWDSIKQKIAKQLGPKGGQAITAAEKAPGIVQTISKGLHNSDEFTKEVLPTLKTEAVDGIKSAAQEGLIRAGIGVLLKLIPGAGTVLAIFDTVRVLIDRGKDIVSLASNVMGAFSAIAGGNLATAAIAVENSLVSGIKVALDFIAKLAKIDTFISRVRDIIGKVTTKISSVVDPIIKKAANFVRPYLDKLTGKPSSTTAVKPGSSTAIPAPSNVKTNSSDPKNQNDTRTLEQKKQAVNDAEKAADGLLLEKDATPESVKAKLPTLKQQYKLNRIELVTEKDDEYHVVAEINPTATTPSRKLHTEFYPENIQIQSTATGIDIEFDTRAGKHFKMQMARSGHVTKAQGFDLDLTTLGRGITQDPSNKEKNKGQNSAHIIANWFGGSGYKKSLNLIATSDHFNKKVMGAAERQIVQWVGDNSIVHFDLNVNVDWGIVSEEAIVNQVISQLKTVDGNTSAPADKIRRRLLKELVEFKPKLQAVEDVVYRSNGKKSDGTSASLSPISTGKDTWL
jgi:DNA/RNA non-specific endonuclease